MEIYVKLQDSINEYLKRANPGDIIILEEGTYLEKVEVWVDNITIKSNTQATIANKDYYHKIMANHNECNTFNTFTVLIGSNNVILENITIKNLAVPSNIYGQAVALHVLGNNFICNNCNLISNQDTLFTGPLPKDLCVRYKGFYEEKRLLGTPSIQKYINCKISGDVDFIFGCATALFENCDIICLPSKKTQTFICAPAHSKETEYGYLFYKCNIISAHKEPYTYLGRPWRDYGCAAFIDCYMESHILPIGYDKWGNTNRDKTARFYEYTKGLNLSQRAHWINILNEESAIKYVNNFKKYISQK